MPREPGRGLRGMTVGGGGESELCSEEITLSESEIIKFLSKLGGTPELICSCTRYVNISHYR